MRLDPRNAPARYYVGRAQIAGGLSDWRALLADMAHADPRRSALQAEIDQVGSDAVLGRVPTAPPLLARAPGAPLAGPQAAFIQAMVARQAAELKADPGDPQGWARLVRSYGVLGDIAAQQPALAEARRVFAKRPAELAPIKAEPAPRPAG